MNPNGWMLEIAFDLVQQHQKGTSFETTEVLRPEQAGTIIDRAIIYHYNRHRPYCYTFWRTRQLCHGFYANTNEVKA